MTDIQKFKNNDGIIVIDSVVNSDLPFDERKQIIKDNPISLYEVLSKETGKAYLDKLYEFACEKHLKVLENVVLTNNKELIEKKLIQIVSCSYSPNNILACKTKEELLASISACRNRAYKQIDVLIKEKKKQDAFEAEKKRIESLSTNFNKEFFKKLKKQFDKVDYSFEYAIIKLVSKLESKLRSTRKTQEEEQDLEALINAYYKNEEERHLLHKLRMTRNNYLHPNKEELMFTRDMFDQCLELIFK